jgi:hypothetical protein
VGNLVGVADAAVGVADAVVEGEDVTRALGCLVGG